MQDLKKPLLYGLLVAVSVMLWNAWQVEQATVQKTKQKSAFFTPAADVASVVANKIDTRSTSDIPTGGDVKASAKRDLVHIKTDVLDLAVDRRGGQVVSAKLLAYPQTQKPGSTPVSLLTDKGADLSLAQGGITGDASLIFSSPSSHYSLGPRRQRLEVTLQAQSNSGVVYTKTFSFKRGDYHFQVQTAVKNQSAKAWNGRAYTQLVHNKPAAAERKLFQFRTYEGPAYFTPNKPYTKLNYSTMDEANLDAVSPGGWIAVQQRYFIRAWVMDKNQTHQYFSQVLVPKKRYVLGMLGPQLHLSAGEGAKTSSTLYIGPEITRLLKPLAHGLDLTIDYGWLWIVSKAIFWVMSHIHTYVGNWGLAIILVTLLIKLAFYRLSESSYRSMANMRKLQPRLEEIKRQYSDDKEKLGQATMELYRKEKMNPLGGCLPMLIQIPFFIALYWVLMEAVQLRHAPFIGWITDLSTHDPFYVLPVLMGASMLLQQRLSPSPPDPAQAKMMMVLPVVFTFMFLSFPAGLVLYWVTNNLLSIAQQWYITKRVVGEGSAGPRRGSKVKKKPALPANEDV